MPKSKAEVLDLLDRLDDCVADDLEDQDLDFKEWDFHSLNKSVRTAVAAAVCMANGGGGTVVFGVADRRPGRDSAILGVPPAVSVNRLRLAVHDGTDPKLTPVFEEVPVPEGTGRLILMHVYPGMAAFHTDTAGRGTVRVGTECKPLTGTTRRRLAEAFGDADYTAVPVDALLSEIVSPAAMEALRLAAKRERAPEDLLGLSDPDLLEAIGVIRDGRPTRAAVLLAGSSFAIRKHVPGYLWTHARMSSSTDYSDRADGNDAIPVAEARLLDRIMADNPIETVPHGLYHHEYRTYPEAALREALLNALCHGDFRVSGPRLVKQYADRIEIANPGGFVGGVTAENILHHAPVARNPCLMDALARLRLVNRMRLGMERMFSSLLMEGKPPPSIADIGSSVCLTFRAATISPRFRWFVADESQEGRLLRADHLLVLRQLLTDIEIDLPTAARLCHRSRTDMAVILGDMETRFRHLIRMGSEGDPSWALSEGLRARLTDHPTPYGRERVDLASAKAVVLRVIRKRAKRGDPPLTNSEVREMTLMNRQQVYRLIQVLAKEGRVRIRGHGRGARYVYTGSSESAG